MYFEPDRSGPPRRRTGVAGFFTRHVNGQLTVLLASYDRPGHRQDFWRLPGGDIQDDEFLHEAYAREVAEKTGLPIASSPEEILVVDHVPRGVTEAEGIDVVFKGGEIPLGIDIVPLTAPDDAEPETGATAYRWATLGETDTLCPGPERDRVHSAHEAWVTGRTAYLICGERFTARRLLQARPAIEDTTHRSAESSPSGD
ncbi:NUDIX domain-containing protein [Streptomyces sp. NBC_01508]|uniref:NUDIX domain-containing protein n=1 Tax=Streptomyces sp. NBC_01508 TaxID=2903888 RepID=UPI00386BE065